MKKVSLTLILAFVTTIALYAQQDSTGQSDASYSYLTLDRILGLLSATGVIGWLVYRLEQAKKAIDTIITAAEDGRISEAEFRQIISAFKTKKAK